MAGRNALSLLSPLLAAALVGCGGSSNYVELKPAQLELSAEEVDFGLLAAGAKTTKTFSISNGGDVPLGIECIDLATNLYPDKSRGHSGAFKLSWKATDVVDPTGSDTDGSAARQDPAIDSAHDTSTPVDTGADTGDSGGGGGGTVSCVEGEVALQLNPGARLPITVTYTPVVGGSNYDAIVVTTVDGAYAEDDTDTPVDEKIYRDVDTTWKMAYLHGEGEETIPNILVTPRQVNFGFVWPGQCETEYVSIKNVGEGDLTILDVAEVESTCSEGFEMTAGPSAGKTIGGGIATVMEMTFCPEGDAVEEAQCKYRVTSDDIDSPTIDVKFEANSGDNPENKAPTVKIHDPKPGYVHQGWGPISMELTVFDANQPAESLTCKVQSALQLNASLLTCTPTTESGHFWVDVPIVDSLEAGLDVLRVTVTDESGVTRRASVPVLINTTWPEDDDDGDGFVADDPDYADCDDANAYTYPLAAEIADGMDNDCDLQIDEGTDGADDDGDGMSEDDGDCDDENAETYRGAPEVQDSADNDCDGTIDENTSIYDDDGDGFSELDQDCDDTDPNVNPSTPEVCGDGLDNNCNGLKDSQEPCTANDSEPMIVGQINLSRTSIEVGEGTQASVKVYEADEDNITHSWQVKDGAGNIDDPAAPAITWSAPSELPADYSKTGNVYRIYYQGNDDDDNQVWDFGEVWVYPENALDTRLVVQMEGDGGGCSTVPLAPAGMLAGLGLLAAAMRRRED